MILYHYCSAAKFEEIIKSKVLWMANLTQSNDAQEVSISYQRLWESAKERLLCCEDLDEEIVAKTIELVDSQFAFQYLIDLPFGTCFCSQGDVLQQWLEYGDRTQGLCLGFDLDWFSTIKREAPHPSVSIRQSCGCYPILYYSRKLEERFYQLCHKSIEEYGIQAWVMGIMPTFRHYSAFIKNETFEGEKEIRIVYYPSHGQTREDNPMRISELVADPFPHYCLPWANGESSALREIIRGCNCTLSEQDVKAMILREAIPAPIQFYHSASSYRLR